MHYGVCSNCGARGIVERHHVFFKSKAKALKNCNLNLVDLCTDCHRGTNGVHGPHGHKLDIKLKKETQAKIFDTLRLKKADAFRDEVGYCEPSEILGIPFNETCKAFKDIKVEWGKCKIEDVVRALQGGKLY